MIWNDYPQPFDGCAALESMSYKSENVLCHTGRSLFAPCNIIQKLSSTVHKGYYRRFHKEIIYVSVLLDSMTSTVFLKEYVHVL